ncbi:MAG: hypothetical protein WA821_14505, partial [Anaerolineales bacterium]
MDNNLLLIMWAVIVVATLGLDTGAYLLLRTEWKKSGVLPPTGKWLGILLLAVVIAICAELSLIALLNNNLDADIQIPML